MGLNREVICQNNALDRGYSNTDVWRIVTVTQDWRDKEKGSGGKGAEEDS